MKQWTSTLTGCNKSHTVSARYWTVYYAHMFSHDFQMENKMMCLAQWLPYLPVNRAFIHFWQCVVNTYQVTTAAWQANLVYNDVTNFQYKHGEDNIISMPSQPWLTKVSWVQVQWSICQIRNWTLHEKEKSPHKNKNSFDIKNYPMRKNINWEKDWCSKGPRNQLQLLRMRNCCTRIRNHHFRWSICFYWAYEPQLVNGVSFCGTL